ncbi:hypothetical protein GOODEAATRI_031248 [Goodea atripinnis]|uniref:Uncharacterized protein n=1 Tax=Goodea atripinnis TaxID=208336 RepID=A0ABV0NQR2_9TELE
MKLFMCTKVKRIRWGIFQPGISGDVKERCVRFCPQRRKINLNPVNPVQNIPDLENYRYVLHPCRVREDQQSVIEMWDIQDRQPVHYRTTQRHTRLYGSITSVSLCLQCSSPLSVCEWVDDSL